MTVLEHASRVDHKSVNIFVAPFFMGGGQPWRI